MGLGGPEGFEEMWPCMAGLHTHSSWDMALPEALQLSPSSNSGLTHQALLSSFSVKKKCIKCVF